MQKNLSVWYVFTDASYEQSTKTGGLGGVLVNEQGQCCAWFGFPLDADQCKRFGSETKQTIIYELELAAAVLALDFWADQIRDGLQVWFGDNDGVRFSLIKGSCISECGASLLKYHLEREVHNNLSTWFARVPTEANISDFPSRQCHHPLLTDGLDFTKDSLVCFQNLLKCCALEPVRMVG